MSRRLRYLTLALFACGVALAVTAWTDPGPPRTWQPTYVPPPDEPEAVPDLNYSLIEPGLYLGGAVREPPPDVRAVLNLCENEDAYRAEVHRWEPIPDSEPAPALSWLARMVAFVDEQRRAGTPTYVHCFGGRSRAGLVVAAYLMSREGWSRDQALAYIRGRRPIVEPNPGFMDLLLAWEKHLAAK